MENDTLSTNLINCKIIWTRESLERGVVIRKIYSIFILFHPLEQAYQHCKSSLFGQAEYASKIMTSCDPAQAKRISYEMNGPRDLQGKWDEQRIDLMTSLLRAKCEQNQEGFENWKYTLREILMKIRRKISKKT